jgi:hypothetical protein
MYCGSSRGEMLLAEPWYASAATMVLLTRTIVWRAVRDQRRPGVPTPLQAQLVKLTTNERGGWTTTEIGNMHAIETQFHV